MTARAMWKGVIRYEELKVPVKLYAGVNDRKVHFRLLHRSDRSPVIQKMVHPRTGKPVAAEEIIRGYEIEKGEFVILTEDELKNLEPEESRDIEVTCFVDPMLINHQWYDRPYYLGPDGNDHAYYILAEALKKAKAEAIARWTMRKKNYLGILRAENGYLQAITLRYANQIIDVSSFSRPEFRALEKQELQMAEQLVKALESGFTPSEYKDEYRNRVQELVRTKAGGGTLKFKKVEKRKPEAASLADMLRRSLQRVKEERKSA